MAGDMVAEHEAGVRASLAWYDDVFAVHGIPTRSDHALWWALAGITQKFIKPHCPWQNGKAERFNRTLATEWAYRRVFTTNDQRTAALAPWLEHYNTERRHSALGGRPPISRLSPT